MHAALRTAVITLIASVAAGTSTMPAFAGQVVQEPGFVSGNASCDGSAHALISHYVGNVGTITSNVATTGPGAVSDRMTSWAHQHGDPITCVGPE